MGAGLWAFFLQSLKIILNKGWHKNLAKRKGKTGISQKNMSFRQSALVSKQSSSESPYENDL
jgi:hypothetical protein